MQRALGHIVISTTLTLLGFAAGCSNRGTTEISRDETQTGGEEGMYTKDADGHTWVTPDVGAAEEKAEEDAIGDVDQASPADSAQGAPPMEEDY